MCSRPAAEAARFRGRCPALVALVLIVTTGPVAAVAAPPATPAEVPAPSLPPPGEMERCLRLIGAGRHDEARARLAPIVAAHPGWQRATFLLALSYHEQQRYGEACPLLARALEIDRTSPDVPAIRLHHGWCAFYLGDRDTARRELEAFLALRPDDADAHFGLGLLDFDGDDIAAATARFETAIRLARDAGDARQEGKARARLADVLVRTGDLPRAREELEAAVALRPDAYEAYFKLSRVLERLGHSEAAARALERHHEVREQVQRAEGSAP